MKGTHIIKNHITSSLLLLEKAADWLQEAKEPDGVKVHCFTERMRDNNIKNPSSLQNYCVYRRFFFFFTDAKFKG